MISSFQDRLRFALISVAKMTAYEWGDLPWQPLERHERLTEAKFTELVPQLQRAIEDLRNAAYEILVKYPLGIIGAEIGTKLR